MLEEYAKELLYQQKLTDSVRLLGISLSNLNTAPQQEKQKKNPEHLIAPQIKLPF